MCVEWQDSVSGFAPNPMAWWVPGQHGDTIERGRHCSATTTGFRGCCATLLQQLWGQHAGYILCDGVASKVTTRLKATSIHVHGAS